MKQLRFSLIMKNIQSTQIYSDLRRKEKLSDWRKYYPWKEVLLIPDIALPKNIRVIKRFYVVLRKFDDICDWDDQLWIEANLTCAVIDALVDDILNWKYSAKSYGVLERYLMETFKIIFNIWWPKLLEEFRKIAHLCINTLLFDKRRIEQKENGDLVKMEETDIEKYIDDLELNWVLRWLLILLGYKDLDIWEFKEMIIATRRYYYFSRDIEEDTRDGLVNYTDLESSLLIIQDEMKRKWMSILNTFLSWENPLNKLRLIDRLIVGRLYIKPAKKYFNS